jgi:hypothetical protein
MGRPRTSRGLVLCIRFRVTGRPHAETLLAVLQYLAPDDHSRLCKFEAPNPGKMSPARHEKQCRLAVKRPVSCLGRVPVSIGVFSISVHLILLSYKKAGPPRRSDSKIAEMVSQVLIITSYVVWKTDRDLSDRVFGLATHDPATHPRKRTPDHRCAAAARIAMQSAGRRRS